MPARDSRYTQIGTNSGGDAVYGLRGAHPVGTTAVAEGSSGEYEDMTKAELEELLVSRDLPKTGNKDELVARLQEDDG